MNIEFQVRTIGSKLQQKPNNFYLTRQLNKSHLNLSKLLNKKRMNLEMRNISQVTSHSVVKKTAPANCSSVLLKLVENVLVVI